MTNPLLADVDWSVEETNGGTEILMVLGAGAADSACVLWICVGRSKVVLRGDDQVNRGVNSDESVAEVVRHLLTTTPGFSIDAGSVESDLLRFGNLECRNLTDNLIKLLSALSRKRW